MKKSVVFILGLTVFMIAGVATCVEEDESYKDVGLAFVKALREADFEQMAKNYADEVTLTGRSELTKEQWGVNPEGDRSEDIIVKRDDLISGYKSLVEKVGVEKWKNLWSLIGDDKISFAVAEDDDAVISGVLKGDAIMTVTTPDENNPLRYVLRKDADGRWLIMIEDTDY